MLPPSSPCPKPLLESLGAVAYTMLITIIIVFISLIGLLVLHELGHFVVAKKFGVEVEEFGVGYPPRLFGKKIGQTLYSLNALPFGAFVKIKGEEGAVGIEDASSFGHKRLWQRGLIIGGGVMVFWLASFVILTIVSATSGIPTAVTDQAQVARPEVQIIEVAEGSPAARAGLRAGDVIKKIQDSKRTLGDVQQGSKIQDIKTIKQVQEFTREHLGENLGLTIKRGSEVFEVDVLARSEPPENEGSMGVGLARVSWEKAPFYKAPLVAAQLTLKQTITIPLVLGKALKQKLAGEKVLGLRFAGPVGVGQVMSHALERGWGSFLFIVAMIAIWLALFNVLPIPALDGGKLLFLSIEWARNKPVAVKTEQRISAFFFAALLVLMALITIKDILGLF